MTRKSLNSLDLSYAGPYCIVFCRGSRLHAGVYRSALKFGSDLTRPTPSPETTELSARFPVAPCLALSLQMIEKERERDSCTSVSLA